MRPVCLTDSRGAWAKDGPLRRDGPMARTEFFDLVRLPPEARDVLLASLETDANDATARHGRKSTRHSFRGDMMPFVVMQPGGSVGAYLVMTRNLSAGGLAVIHGGYLHPGTKCRMLLATISGQNVVLGGRVRRCRHIRGNLHEIGVEFNTQIAPEQFVPPEFLNTTVEEMIAPEPAAEESVSPEQAKPEHAEAAPGESHATPDEHKKAA